MTVNLKPGHKRKLKIASFKIDCKKYVTPVLSFKENSLKMMLNLKNINNLNEDIILRKSVSVSVLFPFKSPHSSTLISKTDFITTKDIIDFIREMFFSCYRSMTTFPCDIESEGKFNNLYELTYPIKCLHVEDIYYCEDKHKITLKVIGNPVIRKEPDYPF